MIKSRPLILLALVYLLGGCIFSVRSEIIESGEEKIVFSPASLNRDVTWSKNLSLKSTGIEAQDMPENQSQDIWIQTHPFPIGLSWRPPSAANFSLIVNASPDIEPQYFIRYSCDKVNWSSWYVFSKVDGKQKDVQNNYETRIWLPYLAYERYRQLMREWWKTSPNWSSDENEFCEWLVKREYDFFAKDMPFIGYVQVRAEKIFARSAFSIKSITIRYSWAVGGLSSIPKDRSKSRETSDEKWYFVGHTN